VLVDLSTVHTTAIAVVRLLVESTEEDSSLVGLVVNSTHATTALTVGSLTDSNQAEKGTVNCIHTKAIAEKLVVESTESEGRVVNDALAVGS